MKIRSGVALGDAEIMQVRGEGVAEVGPMVGLNRLEARVRHFWTSSRKAIGSLCPGAQLLGCLMR